MKRFFALLLALGLLLSLTACGEPEPTGTKNKDNKPTNGNSQPTKGSDPGATEPLEKVTAYIDTVTTYRADGTITEVETYTYDAEGNQIAAVCHSSDGAQVSREAYTYENGRLIQTDRWYGPEDQKVSTVIHEYDAQGLLIKETTYEPDGSINLLAEYTYDDQGKQVELRQYLSDNEFLAHFTFVWEGDLLIKYLSYTEDGTLEFELCHTYNDRGDVATSTQTSSDGYTVFYEYTYDDQGLLIKMDLFLNGTLNMYKEYTYKSTPTGP